jgi:hypothetical protein
MVIAADSAVTVSGVVVDESGGQHSGVLKVFERARKIFQLGELPVGLAALGISAIGKRTVASYLEEFELENLDAIAPGGKYPQESLHPLCSKIWKFLQERYRAEFQDALEREKAIPYDEIALDARPSLVVLVAGYGHKKPLGELWQINAPLSEVGEAVVQLRAPGDFGANWFGVIGPVTRFIKGFDARLPEGLHRRLKDKLGEKADEVWPDVEGLLNSLEYKIAYMAMPLEDGIEHVRYLAGLSINFARFALGPPVCGGDVQLATITARQGFTRLER